MSARLVAALAVALSVGACGGPMEQDDSVRFLSPPDRARVTLPVVIDWKPDRATFRAAGFDGTAQPDRGLYAVFIDRSPIAPGEHIESLADGDRLCTTAPGCPDRRWLADRGVHLTRRSRLSLAHLPASGRPAGGLRRHRATVVKLDGRGVRHGEASWSLVFYAPGGRA